MCNIDIARGVVCNPFSWMDDNYEWNSWILKHSWSSLIVWLHMFKIVDFTYWPLAEMLQIFFCLFPVHCDVLFPLALNSARVMYTEGFPSVWSVNLRSVTSQTLCLVLVPFSFSSSQSPHPWGNLFSPSLMPFLEKCWLFAGRVCLLVFRCLLVL